MRSPPALLSVLVAILAAATLARLPLGWERGNGLNHVSGAWMTLADDLARGTFYRPLEDPSVGYGGTRFFPLVFALQAALRSAGADLLEAGFVVSFLAGAMLLVAAIALLRRCGLPLARAAAFAILPFGAFAAQHALTSARGDLVPVALGVAGLAVVAGAPSRARVPLAAALFIAAFAAKPTALTAPAAAAAWLLLRRERRAALALSGLVASGAWAVVLVTDALSDGRFLDTIRACATGGAGLADLVRAPVRLADLLVRADRAALVLAVMASASAVALLHAPREARALSIADLMPSEEVRRSPAALVVLWLGASFAAALAVFASPGTGANHLLELAAASGATLGAVSSHASARPAASPWAARLPRFGAPLAAVVGIFVVVSGIRADLGTSRLGELRELAAVLPDEGPILSEDPLVPLVAGKRPFLLDPWMLRVAAARNPDVDAPLRAAIRARAFPTVVLFRDLAHDEEAPRWYARGNLGLGVVEEIRRAYRSAGRIGRYHVYVPAPPPGERSGPVVRAIPIPPAIPKAAGEPTPAQTASAAP